MKLPGFIQRFLRFIGHDVWQIGLDAPKKKRTLAYIVKTVMDSVDNMRQSNVGLLSVSLCYFCVMAAVPFIAVCFVITGGVGLSENLKDFLFGNFGEDSELVIFIVNAADNILETAQSGWVGLVSALLFIWLVIWMMDRIEKVFNIVWNIDTGGRSRLKAYAVDLAIMIFAPFILLLFFFGSVVYTKVLDVWFHDNFGFSAGLTTFVGWIIFGAAVILILTAMYKFIPATHVKTKYAFRSAVLAGVAFTVLQYLYLETQLMVVRINAVYGAIAAIPLMLIWLRFGWFIIILGVQINYSIQRVGLGEVVAPRIDYSRWLAGSEDEGKENSETVSGSTQEALQATAESEKTMEGQI